MSIAKAYAAQDKTSPLAPWQFERRNPGPVSYTHLDVYKRQLKYQPSWQKENPLPCPLRWLIPVKKTGRKWPSYISPIRAQVSNLSGHWKVFSGYSWKPVKPENWCLRLHPNNYLWSMKQGDSINPVSYTHLDVYKRQLLHWGLKCILQNWISVCYRTHGTMMPPMWIWKLNILLKWTLTQLVYRIQ